MDSVFKSIEDRVESSKVMEKTKISVNTRAIQNWYNIRSV